MSQDDGAALLPLEDAPDSLLRDPNTKTNNYNTNAFTFTRTGNSSNLNGNHSVAHSYRETSPSPVITSATADFQRSLVQQQLLQCQKELRTLKDELYDTSGRLSNVTTKLNEQKVEYGALTHRYAAAIEKLTNAEGDVKKLEEQLVQERTRFSSVREDGEQLRQQLRESIRDCEALQRQVEELQSNRGLDRREVQRLLEDRGQYVPTVEVRRVQAELRDSQQSLVDRLQHALDSLLSSAEESATNLFVARSAVLSSATDLETRVLRAEAALDQLQRHMTSGQSELEEETSDFLLALIAENKELWQHLTRLQAEHDLTESELALLKRKGDSVPAEQHHYVQRQLESMSERLRKAQQVMAAQTALAREHEAEMKELLQQNADLEARLRRLQQQQQTEEETGKKKSAALSEADAALKAATEQVRALQEAVVTERQSADETVARLTETQQTMQREFETRLRTAQTERATLEATAESTSQALEEATHRIAALEKELQAKSSSFEAFRAKTEEAGARQQQGHQGELQHLQDALAQEMDALHARLAAAQQEARAAVRERDDARAEAQTLVSTVRTIETELSRQRAEADTAAQRSSDTLERLRVLQAEKDALQSQCGVTGLSTKEMEKQIGRLTSERDDLRAELRAEQERGQQRYERGQQDWRASEKARASLQDEMKLLRTRFAELETQRLSSERNTQDREHLMKENMRLQEQYVVIQRENAALAEELAALRARSKSSSELAQQLSDLQHRLRELPQLRQATDDARRDALKAREETEALRKDRDEMAARLDYFLEESKAAAEMDEAFDRVVRDAGEAVKRLGGQVTSAKSRGGAVATTTITTAGASSSPATHVVTPPRGASATYSSTSGLSAVQHSQRMKEEEARRRGSFERGSGGVRTPGRDAAVLTREAAAMETNSRSPPQRPWKG